MDFHLANGWTMPDTSVNDGGVRAGATLQPAVTCASRPAPAWTPLLAISGAVTSLLLAVAGAYGYHRDELYFLQAGRHLAFGYVDQPPLTPLMARAATELFGPSLVGIRLMSALAAGLVVVLTGLIAREFGGDRGAQLLAAASMGLSAYLLAVGHLLSTSSFDLLAWAAVSWLVVRGLRDGGPVWLAVGVIAGLGLQNKTLMAFLLLALAVGLLAVGPRRHLGSGWVWAAGGLALLVWSPNLVWQAAHGWPQFELAEAIAAGSSGTSEPWWLMLPMQAVMVSPLLAPVWVAGLWRLARDGALSAYRAFAVAYALLAGVFMLTGGKPYYLAGLYPVLLAAGAEPTLRWVRAEASGLGRVLLAVAVAVGLAVNVVLMLPVVPVSRLAETPITDTNYDAGETVGWPELARTVSRVYGDLPAAERERTIVLTRNYGQAGAVDRYGPALGLPAAYSGHNSYADWGQPPPSADTAVVVGYERDDLDRWFDRCDSAATVDNGVGVDNDEQGNTVWVCRNPVASWDELWPDVRHLG